MSISILPYFPTWIIHLFVRFRFQFRILHTSLKMAGIFRPRKKQRWGSCFIKRSPIYSAFCFFLSLIYCWVTMLTHGKSSSHVYLMGGKWWKLFLMNLVRLVWCFYVSKSGPARGLLGALLIQVYCCFFLSQFGHKVSCFSYILSIQFIDMN